MKTKTTRKQRRPITHKQDKSIHPYYLSNTELRFVVSYKDLGVNTCMSRYLFLSNHVDVIVNKANKVLLSVFVFEFSIFIIITESNFLVLSCICH